MEKTFHFMAGLPRSGSTVLSALLNQHPDVYASPQTDLLQMLYLLETEIPNLEAYKAGLMPASYPSVKGNLAKNFYAHVNKPVIIDKNRGWGTPFNFGTLSDQLNPEGKVILTMRPILEVLASFVKVTRESKKVTNNLSFFDPSFYSATYRDEADAQIDNLMRSNGEIDHAFLSIFNLLKNHKDRVKVVWFDELISFPQKTLSGIYSFLEIDNYAHNFNKIKPVDDHNDLYGYGIIGLHDVGKKLKPTQTKPEDYLSRYSIDKYGEALSFLNGLYPA